MPAHRLLTVLALLNSTTLDLKYGQMNLELLRNASCELIAKVFAFAPLSNSFLYYPYTAAVTVK